MRLFTCLFVLSLVLAAPLSAQLTVAPGGTLTLTDDARLDVDAARVDGRVELKEGSPRFFGENLTIGDEGEVAGDGAANYNLNVSTVTVTDGGRLLLPSPTGGLFAFGALNVNAGGLLELGGYSEAGALDFDGDVVFIIPGPASGEFGRIYSEGDDLNVNGRLISRLVGYEPTTDQTYRVLELDQAFDVVSYTPVVPGPGWRYRTEEEYVDLIFDATILPVEWLDVTAAWRGKTARVGWRTATETATSHFEVQRQNAAGGWDELGTVAAAGNSATEQAYHFDDASPGDAPVLYYRLRQVDLDGGASFSPIVSLRQGGNSGLLLYPNPVVDRLNVSGAAPGPYRITDAAGREIARGQLTEPAQRVELAAGLPPGTYVLRDAAGASRKFTVKR